MEISRVDTTKRWSSAVVHNGVAYFCGQVAKETIPDIAVQTRMALEAVEAELCRVNSNKHNLLLVTIYLKDMSDFQKMNEVWDAWVPDGFAPARVCVECSASNPAYLVEIAVIAAVCE